MTGAREASREPDVLTSERTASYGPTAQPDPFQLLVAEHALLRRDLERELLSVGRRSPAQDTERRLGSLLTRLRLHTDREDDVLAPICERLFGGKEGAVAVLRKEHEALRKGLESLGQDAPTPERRRRKLERLRSQLESHFTKEERVLFPLMAALLSSREAASLARRLRVVSVSESGR